MSIYNQNCNLKINSKSQNDVLFIINILLEIPKSAFHKNEFCSHAILTQNILYLNKIKRLSCYTKNFRFATKFILGSFIGNMKHSTNIGQNVINIKRDIQLTQ